MNRILLDLSNGRKLGIHDERQQLTDESEILILDSEKHLLIEQGRKTTFRNYEVFSTQGNSFALLPGVEHSGGLIAFAEMQAQSHNFKLLKSAPSAFAVGIYEVWKILTKASKKAVLFFILKRCVTLLKIPLAIAIVAGSLRGSDAALAPEMLSNSIGFANKVFMTSSRLLSQAKEALPPLVSQSEEAENSPILAHASKDKKTKSDTHSGRTKLSNKSKQRSDRCKNNDDIGDDVLKFLPDGESERLRKERASCAK
jgi:hypothetical protein